MTPKVATILSAREWEPDLVAAAQSSARVRLVGRIYRPDEIASMDLDVVVVGAETSWVSPARIRAWRRAGIRVVGVYPHGDHPARKLLRDSGADEILADNTPPEVILRHIRAMPTIRPQPGGQGKLVVIGGARGAPGRTEIAVSLAAAWGSDSRLLLVDLDQDAPAIAIRLGLAPRPDIVDLVDATRTTGRIESADWPTFGPITVVPGSHRSNSERLSVGRLDEFLDVALTSFEVVVVDTPPQIGEMEPIFKRAHHAVLVSEASVSGLVRAARMVADWAGPPPALVLNRHTGPADESIRAARKWTGLDPAAVVKEHPRIRASARNARPPDRILVKALDGLAVPR